MNLSIRTEPPETPEYDKEYQARELLEGYEVKHPTCDEILLIDVIAWLAESDDRKAANEKLVNALLQKESAFYELTVLIESELESAL